MKRLGLRRRWRALVVARRWRRLRDIAVARHELRAFRELADPAQRDQITAALVESDITGDLPRPINREDSR